MKWFFISLVRFYKIAISPLLPSGCIYTPTCSSYMLTAIERFGLIKGTFLGIKRLCRCTPFHKGGIDPVPDNPKGDMKWLI